MKSQETLDLLSKKFGVKPLMSFYSKNGDEVRSVLDCESPEELGIKISPQEWFTAEEGLQTIRALLNHFEKTNSPSAEKRMASFVSGTRFFSLRANTKSAGTLPLIASLGAASFVVKDAVFDFS